MFHLPLSDDDPLAASVPAGASGSRVLTLREGSRIGGRFRLGALVERGRERGVFEATDEETGHRVLLRVTPRAARPDPRLLHPGFAHFVDHGCIGSWYAAVLDPGEGQALSAALRRLPADHLELDAVIAVGVDLLQALDHAHAHGLWHGNLGVHGLHVAPSALTGPPGAGDWGVRVVDFPAEPGPLRDEALPFASPERVNGARGDARSDVYSVGALLYALATGEPPFGVAAHHAREGHLARELPRHPNLPEPLQAVLAVAMAKRPDQRWPSAAALADELLDAWRAIAGEAPAPAATRGGSLAARAPAPLPREATLDPAPVRRFEPVSAWDDEPAPSNALLPALLLAVLCLLAGGLAVGALGVAGALWWATAWGPLAPPSEVPPATPMLTLPTARTLDAPPAALRPEPSPEVAPRDDLTARAAAAGERRSPAATWEGERVPVGFAYDSWEALPEAGFDDFARRARSAERVRLVGHTDDRGTNAANELMGLGRAWSVGVLLAARGVSDARVELASAGEVDPVASNATAEGRAQNRRVTAEVLGTPRVSDLLVPASR